MFYTDIPGMTDCPATLPTNHKYGKNCCCHAGCCWNHCDRLPGKTGCLPEGGYWVKKPNTNVWRAMMSSIKWEKYEKKWCGITQLRTSGAIHIRPSPWKVEGQNLFSLSECQQECAKDHTCEGIVIKRGMEARGPCYMRTTLQPDRCKKSSGHDLYYIRRGIE